MHISDKAETVVVALKTKKRESVVRGSEYLEVTYFLIFFFMLACAHVFALSSATQFLCCKPVSAELFLQGIYIDLE